MSLDTNLKMGLSIIVKVIDCFTDTFPLYFTQELGFLPTEHRPGQLLADRSVTASNGLSSLPRHFRVLAG